MPELSIKQKVFVKFSKEVKAMGHSEGREYWTETCIIIDIKKGKILIEIPSRERIWIEKDQIADKENPKHISTPNQMDYDYWMRCPSDFKKNFPEFYKLHYKEMKEDMNSKEDRLCGNFP